MAKKEFGAKRFSYQIKQCNIQGRPCNIRVLQTVNDNPITIHYMIKSIVTSIGKPPIYYLNITPGTYPISRLSDVRIRAQNNKQRVWKKRCAHHIKHVNNQHPINPFRTAMWIGRACKVYIETLDVFTLLGHRVGRNRIKNQMRQTHRTAPHSNTKRKTHPPCIRTLHHAHIQYNIADSP